MQLNRLETGGARLRKTWLIFFCILIPLFLAAEQKRYTVGPMVNRLETLGKGLLDDGISYGVRLGYNFDEHKAVELSYDYLYNFSQESVPGNPTTNAHQLMANFLYNVKDDRGFIPYMIFGLGVEKYDNSEGSLKSGGIAGIGMGAHFLIVDPISLRFEVKDIVRFSDIGHTFSWTFGLEYSFGKLEKYTNDDIFPFSSYKAPKKAKAPAPAPLRTPEPSAKIAASKAMQKRYRGKKKPEIKKVSSVSAPQAEPLALHVPAPKAVPKSSPASLSSSTKKAEVAERKIKSTTVAKAKPVKETIISLKVPETRKRPETKIAAVKPEKSPVAKRASAAEPKPVRVPKQKPAAMSRVAVREPEKETVLAQKEVAAIDKVSIFDDSSLLEETSAGGEWSKNGSRISDRRPSESVTGESVAYLSTQKSGPKPEVVSAMEKITTQAKPKPPAPITHEPKKEAAEDVCSLDSDGDGIDDCKDICKNTPKEWRVDQKGCATGITMLVNFEFDSTELNERGRANIGMLAAFMQSNPSVNVVIEGHTDSIGTERYNMSLSKRRASKVRDALLDLGIEPGRIKTEAYGESKPIASNKTAAGRAKNRRADALIIRLQKRG